MRIRSIHIVMIVTLITFSVSLAQHCAYDSSSIIIVDVRDATTGKIINGLEITLTDSDGNAYTSKFPRANVLNKFVFFQKTDTLKFGQNRKRTPEERSDFQEFPLCKGCYMLRASKEELQKKYITVKDIVGKNNLKQFKTKIVKITSQNIRSLCTENPIRTSIDSLDAMKVMVTLE